ncbi:MAG: NAD(P)H-dependent oxidoreductase [Erythrobacter sp.]|uniref:flavodoxin family protein n=1 Tax=Erythrobacter sp. TaxID=1042 RepID=UPI00261CAD68|nr:NAD(P)H-dependent oxidoreductase [Erythrobacter sp.]MDJ0977463.1 NAD(P)H-dependent oxidoreductase [Erythrobacter sp.]
MEGASDDPGLLIVWHSRTGASERMAVAAEQAAGKEGRVKRCEAAVVDADQMLAAQGYLFVCPENLGSVSGTMKELFDRLYYPLLGQVEGRAYGTIIAAGSDGTGAQQQIDRIVTGWRLKRVVDPLIVNFDAQTPEAILAPKTVPDKALNACSKIGAALAAGLAMGVF